MSSASPSTSRREPMVREPQLSSRQLWIARAGLACYCLLPVALLLDPPSLRWHRLVDFIGTGVLPGLVLAWLALAVPGAGAYLLGACKRGLRHWPTAMLLAFVASIVMRLLHWAALTLFPSVFTLAYGPAAPRSTGGLPPTVVWLYEAFSAGLGEELMFRAVVLLCLPGARLWLFVIASVGLQMLAHGSSSAAAILISVPVTAIPAAIYFHRTRNLGPLIVFHTFLDLILLRQYTFTGG